MLETPSSWARSQGYGDGKQSDINTGHHPGGWEQREYKGVTTEPWSVRQLPNPKAGNLVVNIFICMLACALFFKFKEAANVKWVVEKKRKGEGRGENFSTLPPFKLST